MCAGQGRTSSHADTDSDSGRIGDAGGDSDNFLGHPVTVQQEFVYSTEPPTAPPSHVIAGQMPSPSVCGPTAQSTHVTTHSRSVVRTSAVCRVSCIIMPCPIKGHSFRQL